MTMFAHYIAVLGYSSNSPKDNGVNWDVPKISMTAGNMKLEMLLGRNSIWSFHSLFHSRILESSNVIMI